MKNPVRNLMNNLLCLMLVFLAAEATSQVPRPAQLPKEEKISGAPKYDKESQRIFNRFTLAIRKLEGYRVDQLESGASYIPDQLLVWYPESELDKIQSVHNKGTQIFGNNFSVRKTCGCEGKYQIELYEIKGIDGNEKGNPGSSDAAKDLGIKEEDQQDNHYLLPYLPSALNPWAQRFNAMPQNFTVNASSKQTTPITIAVLDTGIDFRYQDKTVDGEPQLVFWENVDKVNGKEDEADDPFCLIDDVIGWDFVNNDNNPMDDHSHGTHISGIIAEQLRKNEPDVNYQLMAVKVLDENGVGNTFDAICGILYAAEKGAKVINASWGYYGGSEKLLQRAIRYAGSKGAIFINSAGNERADIAVTKYYPAEYALLGQNNIRTLLFVGALNQSGTLWQSSNIRTEGIYQDGFIATPGENIASLIPFHLQGKVSEFKSGTSMAAPVMSALVAKGYHKYPSADPQNIRSNIITYIKNNVQPIPIKRYGNIYPYYPVQWLNF
ncbi:MAG: S8 family serine peptidase [Lewinella sp.]|nr:S8 family serine peptidase [Lewinella sp.]